MLYLHIFGEFKTCSDFTYFLVKACLQDKEQAAPARCDKLIIRVVGGMESAIISGELWSHAVKAPHGTQPIN
jgi:hypothetical protein